MTALLRLHLAAPLSQGAAAHLSADQAHYLRTVMRRDTGEGILVFNARDGEFLATIAEIGKKGASVVVGERRRQPVLEPDLWLVTAAVKRDPFERIIEKATELGVARILTVITDRTNTNRVREERLAAIAVEAAEQCDRLSVPEVVAARPLAELLADWPPERRLLFCDEAGDDPNAEWGGENGRAAPLLEAVAGETAGPWAILVGPEGGFSPAERARLRALPFVRAATLGPRILRADTAAIVAIALWQAALGDFKRS